MSRKILFKAKRLDNGEWVEGLITIMWGQYHIINPEGENTAYPIDADTICQYTGLTDKNGSKIWENDVVKFENCGTYPIFYDSDYCCLGSCWYSDFDPMYKYRNTSMEVIGNKFDNPGLMEV